MQLAVAGMVVLVAALIGVVDGAGTATGQQAVLAALRGAGAQQRTVEVTVRRDPGQVARQDRLVRSALARALAGTGATVWSSAGSDLLPLAGGARRLPRDGARLVPWVAPDLPKHSRLVSGRWPSGSSTGSSPFQAALQADAAAVLGIRPGDRLTLAATDRSSSVPPAVLVVGLWRAADRADPFWFADPLEVTGTQRAGVYGPLLLPEAAMAAIPVRWQSQWRAAPDLERVATGSLEALAGRVGALPGALVDVPTAGGAQATVDGDLAAVLAGQVRSARQARAATASLLAVLAVLAAACCLLAGILLADLRAAEALLLRARGLGGTGRAGWVLAEAAMLGLLAAVPAAAAAVAVVRLTGPAGPGPGSGDVILVRAMLVRTGLVAAGAAVLAGLAVLLVTDLVLMRAWRQGAGRGTGGRAGESGLDGAGLDGAEPDGAGGARRPVLAAVLLLVPGVLAAWQLRRAGASGALLPSGGTDPIVVLAVPVALLAAGVVVVALLRAACRPLSLLSLRRRAVPALLGWQASRRGARPMAPVVVLAAAAAAAVCTLSAAVTVQDRERAQAATALGTQVLVRAPRQPGAPAGSAGRAAVAGELAGVAGVAVAMPVSRGSAQVGGTGITVLALDAGRLAAGTVPAGGAGISSHDAAALAGARPASQPMPAGDRLTVGVRLAAPADQPGEAPLPAPDQPLNVSLLVAGEDGVPLRISLGAVPPDGRTRVLAAPRPAAARNLVGVELAETATQDGYAAVQADLAVSVAGPQGSRPVPVSRWRLAGQGRGQPDARIGPGSGPGPGSGSGSGSGAGFDVTAYALLSPQDASGAAIRLVVGDGLLSVPAIIDRRVRAAAGAGRSVVLDFGDHTVPLTVVAVVDQVPGLDPDGLSGPGAPGSSGAGSSGAGSSGAGSSGAGSSGAGPLPGVIVNRASLASLDLASGGDIPVADEWWVVGEGRSSAEPDPAAVRAAAAAALSAGSAADRADVPGITVTTRAQLVARFLAQAEPAGLRRLLLLTTAAIGLVAAAAAGLGEVVAAGRRRGELAVLRALGVSGGQLRALVITERLVIGGVAGIAGAAAGWALARLLVPVLAGPVLPALVIAPGLVPSWSVPAALGVLLSLVAVVAGTAAVRAGAAGRIDTTAALRTQVR